MKDVPFDRDPFTFYLSVFLCVEIPNLLLPLSNNNRPFDRMIIGCLISDGGGELRGLDLCFLKKITHTHCGYHKKKKIYSIKTVKEKQKFCYFFFLYD